MAQESSVKASRAIGAMFFSVFGAAWLIVWCLSIYGINMEIIALIVVVTIIILFLSIR